MFLSSLLISLYHKIVDETIFPSKKSLFFSYPIDKRKKWGYTISNIKNRCERRVTEHQAFTESRRWWNCGRVGLANGLSRANRTSIFSSRLRRGALPLPLAPHIIYYRMRKVEALASMRVAPRIFRPYDREVLGRFLFFCPHERRTLWHKKRSPTRFIWKKAKCRAIGTTCAPT